MNEIFDFIEPTSFSLSDINGVKGTLLYTSASVNRGLGSIDWEGVKVAIVGVEDDRGGARGSMAAPEAVRAELYKLYASDFEISLVDLGNIKAGAAVEDTLFALKEVCALLLKQGILPVIIGGAQHFTRAVYEAMSSMEQTINLLTVDSGLDFGEEGEVNDSNYLNAVVLKSPNNLFNYCNLADQRYLNPPELFRMMNELYFDNVRLGLLNEDITCAEPHMRNADLVSFDFKAIRSHELSGDFRNPNGLNPEHACTLAYYAGFSDKVRAFGLFGVDINGVVGSAALAAQMIWCLLDGFSKRKGDFPAGSIEDYHRFTVRFERENHEVVFLKSHLSDRWWMEVPFPAGILNRYIRHFLIPCTYETYLKAADDCIPDLWWMTYRKLA